MIDAAHARGRGLNGCGPAHACGLESLQSILKRCAPVPKCRGQSVCILDGQGAPLRQKGQDRMCGVAQEHNIAL